MGRFTFWGGVFQVWAWDISGLGMGHFTFWGGAFHILGSRISHSGVADFTSRGGGLHILGWRISHPGVRGFTPRGGKFDGWGSNFQGWALKDVPPGVENAISSQWRPILAICNPFQRPAYTGAEPLAKL